MHGGCPHNQQGQDMTRHASLHILWVNLLWRTRCHLDRILLMPLMWGAAVQLQPVAVTPSQMGNRTGRPLGSRFGSNGAVRR